MTRRELVDLIRERQSFLCVGLDPELSRLPRHLPRNAAGVAAFNRAIIDATYDHCVAYKPNLAFYEAMGSEGWSVLEHTLEYIGDNHFLILDAKRGDIGNSSRLYAKAFFEELGADALTVAPYMGEDSVKPFLEFPGHWVVLLALTSNPGSADFQMTPQEDDQPLYEKVMRKAMQWGTPDNLMFVCGATQADHFGDLRRIAPDHFFLVPGVGAQGGDLAAVCQYGLNDDVGLLVNASRGILYAGTGEDFAEKARAEAKAIQETMRGLLTK